MLSSRWEQRVAQLTGKKKEDLMEAPEAAEQDARLLV